MSANPIRPYNPDRDGLRATEKQRDVLRLIARELSEAQIMTMSRESASSQIRLHSGHWRRYPATRHQEKFLRNWCEWTEHMNSGDASDKIAAIKAKTAHMTPEEVSNAIALAQDNWLHRGQ